MLFNILIYAVPAMLMIMGAFLLYYRTTLLKVLGPQTNKVIFSISIMFFFLGVLGFVLVFNGFVDLMLIWLIITLPIMVLIIGFFYYLYKNRP